VEKITITCVDNGKSKIAEVLTRNDKYIKVVLEGTQITIELHRTDLNRAYVGRTAGLEFEWQPKN